jgi:hypothetical protein
LRRALASAAAAVALIPAHAGAPATATLFLTGALVSAAAAIAEIVVGVDALPVAAALAPLTPEPTFATVILIGQRVEAVAVTTDHTAIAPDTGVAAIVLVRIEIDASSFPALLGRRALVEACAAALEVVGGIGAEGATARLSRIAPDPTIATVILVIQKIDADSVAEIRGSYRAPTPSGNRVRDTSTIDAVLVDRARVPAAATVAVTGQEVDALSVAAALADRADGIAACGAVGATQSEPLDAVIP